MSNKFSRSSKMQTAPAVCHTSPVPVPPAPPTYPKQLECFAVRKCSTPTCGAYKGTDSFDVKQVLADPPFLYRFENKWSDEPITCYLKVELRTPTDFKTFTIWVWFLYQYPAPPNDWKWLTVKPRSQKPFYMPWKRKKLYPWWTNHQLQISITETGLVVFPPKGFSGYHPRVLPF